MELEINDIFFHKSKVVCKVCFRYPLLQFINSTSFKYPSEAIFRYIPPAKGVVAGVHEQRAMPHGGQACCADVLRRKLLAPKEGVFFNKNQ